MPVCIDNFLRSVRLLTAAIDSFRIHCLAGLTADRERMAHNLHASLMTVTALTPHRLRERSACSQARPPGLGHLRDACLSLGYMTAAEFDRVFHPEQMVRAAPRSCSIAMVKVEQRISVIESVT